jgi:arylsulfatase A-like enzyme
VSSFQGAKTNVGTRTKRVTANTGSVTNRRRVLAGQPLRRDPTTYSQFVLVLDDIGPEHFSFYDQGLYSTVATPKARTPNLDALAAAGLIFDNAYAAPVCSPTRAGINTGLVAHKTGQGTTSTATESPPSRLDDSLQWLPEALRDGRGQGVYFRSAWGKWHLCTPIVGGAPTGNDGHPSANGYQRYGGQMINAGGNAANGDYDHYVWRYVTNSGVTVTSTQIGATADYLAEGVAVPGSNASYATDNNWDAGRNARDFVAWANGLSRPFIAYFCPNPPHAPYQVPPLAYLSGATIAELAAEGMAQGYKVASNETDARRRLVFRAGIEAVDYWVGWIRDNLNPTKLATMMTIVSGDNGTQDDCVDETEDAPLVKAHAKRTVYAQGCRVPFFVHGPLVAAPGRRTSHMVHSIDIYRTCIDIGVAPLAFTHAPADLDSKSFYPIIRNPAATPARDRIWTHTFSPNVALGAYPAGITRDTYSIRDASWSYVFLFANNVVTEQFFNLSSDPWETTNLYASGAGGLSSTQLANFLRLKAEAAAVLAT